MTRSELEALANYLRLQIRQRPTGGVRLTRTTAAELADFLEASARQKVPH